MFKPNLFIHIIVRNFDLTCFLNSILIHIYCLIHKHQLECQKKSTINDFYHLKNSSGNISHGH